MIDMEEKDIRLLAYFAGEADVQERKEVEAWKDASEENRLYFEQFARNYYQFRAGARLPLIAGYRFVQFQHRLRHRLRLRIIGWIAASMALLLGVGGTFLFFRTSALPETLVRNETEILPGKQEAVLILSSGEKVAVTSEPKELKEKNGTSIQIDTTGKILYASAEQKTSQVVYNTLSIPRGGEFSMVLADGTKVWLNSATELKYPVSFAGKERVVYLEGEAYFDVRKDPNCPFIVVADEMRVEVSGTEFNVNTHFKDYIETVLVRGKVEIVSSGRRTSLNPDQKAVFARDGGEVCVEDVDVSSYVGWKDGNFIFYNESLENIMDQLALWYDVEVFYLNPAVKKVLLSGEMKRYEDIRNLLYFFEKSSNVKFEIKGKTITIGYK